MKDIPPILASDTDERRYRGLLETVGEGFLLLDYDFRVLEANAEAVRLDGRPKDELIGRSHWDAWPDSVGTPIEVAYRKAMQERVPVFFKHRLVSAKHNYCLEIRAYPVQDGIASFFRDVTEAETALTSLQESGDRFDAAMSAIGVLWTNDASGKMTGAQPGWSGLTGQTQAQYEGFGWAAAVHPEDAEPTVRAWNQAVSEKRTFAFEHRIRRFDGVWRTFAIKAVPVLAKNGLVREWVGVHTDITERKEFERALAVKEARLSLATEAAELGIWAWDPVRDLFTWENDRVADIFGFRANAEPVNAAALARMYFHAEDVARFEDALERTLTRGARFNFQGRIYQNTTGQLRWVEVFGTRYEVETGVRGILGTVADITERKKGEEALHSTAEQLTDADRRKTEFMVTLAHELRNPLAPIRNGLQVLRMAIDNPATVARVTTLMERQVGQMVHIIDDLLDVARISRGEVALRKSVVDFKQIATLAVESCLPLIETRHHDLIVDIGTEAIPLFADQARLAQVVVNLLNNAAKYTPPYGTIRLTAVRHAASVDITVTDSGAGIPEQALATVFDMFMQVNQHKPHAQGGLGIGLSLVRTLVELHDGTVVARSPGEGLGSSFVVHLPLAQRQG